MLYGYRLFLGPFQKQGAACDIFFQPFAIASVRIRGASTKSEDLIKFGVDLLGIVLQGAELDAWRWGEGEEGMLLLGC